MRRHVPQLILSALILLTACTPEATPFPVDMPTAAGEILATPPAVVRYALASNTQHFVSDLALIEGAAQVEYLIDDFDPTELGTHFDIVAAYGDLPEGIHSPITPHIAAVINTAISPLNNEQIAALLRRSFNPQALIENLAIPGATADLLESLPQSTLRTELANAGWPDGIELDLLFVPMPGVEGIINNLQAAGFLTRTLSVSQQNAYQQFSESPFSLALITWHTAEERQQWTAQVGEANVLDLYSIPISYRAVTGIEVSFTPSGWPLPQAGD